MIRRALKRELEHIRAEDMSAPQLIGRAFPRLPAGTALPEVREEAEDLLDVDEDDSTVEVPVEEPPAEDGAQTALNDEAIATDGGTPLSRCNREEAGGE